MVSTGLALLLVFTGISFADSQIVSNVLAKSYVYVFDGEQKTLGSSYYTLEYQNRVYVPVRFIAESLGMKVKYDSNGQVVSFSNPKKKVNVKHSDSEEELKLLQNRIRQLEESNELLKRELKESKNSMMKEFNDKASNNSFASLPVYNLDKNIRVTVRDAFFDWEDNFYVDVHVEHISKEGGKFLFEPTKAVLLVDGREYEASIPDRHVSLFKTLQNPKDVVEGGILFKGVKKELKEENFTLKFVYTDEQGFGQNKIFSQFRLK